MPGVSNITDCHGKVGLDIGSHSVKGVHIVDRGAERCVRSAGSEIVSRQDARTANPDNPAVAAAVRSLWNRAGFDTHRVVLALPPEAVFSKWLHLEASDETELAEIARSLAIRGAPFPPGDAVVDYRILSSRTAGTRNVYFVMVVAASSAAIDGLLNLSERAGLEPVAVDFAACAVLRSFDAQKRTASALWTGQPRAHCVIGGKNSIITVARNGALEFARAVPVGGNDFTGCMADAIGCDLETAERIKMSPGTRLEEDGTILVFDDNAEVRVSCVNPLNRLAREIQRSLRYFASQFAEGSYLGVVGTATMSGGGALLKGLSEGLCAHGVDVSSVINPFAGFPIDSGTGNMRNVYESSAAYTTAVGLAMGDYSQLGYRTGSPKREGALSRFRRPIAGQDTAAAA